MDDPFYVMQLIATATVWLTKAARVDFNNIYKQLLQQMMYAALFDGQCKAGVDNYFGFAGHYIKYSKAEKKD